MSQQTPNLAMPVMMPSQAQKHITHNEALELLDAIVQLKCESIDLTTPPQSPSEGQCWAVPSGALGSWAGQDGKLATWRGGGWLFLAPKDGWLMWCAADTTLYARSSGDWQPLATLTP